MVQRLLAALVLAATCSPLHAAVQPRLDPSGTGLVSPELRDALLKIKQAAPKWTSVNLRVYSGSGAWLDVSEPFLRISLNGSRSGTKRYNFSGWVGSEHMSFSADSEGANGWRFWGFDVNVDARPFGSGWILTGWLGREMVNIHVNKMGDRSYNIWGQSGVNLNGYAWGNDLTLDGTVDLARFNAKALAGLGAALGVLNAPAPATLPKKPLP